MKLVKCNLGGERSLLRWLCILNASAQGQDEEGIWGGRLSLRPKQTVHQSQTCRQYRGGWENRVPCRHPSVTRSRIWVREHEGQGVRRGGDSGGLCSSLGSADLVPQGVTLAWPAL